jgi:mRNA interferase MazF
LTQRADVVLARFPFTDQTGAKLRPVLVLSPVPGGFNDFVVMFISSQSQHAVPGIDVIIEPRSSSFAATGLRVTSVFRVGKVATLSDALIVGTLGQLDTSAFDEVVSRLVRLLRADRNHP